MLRLRIARSSLLVYSGRPRRPPGGGGGGRGRQAKGRGRGQAIPQAGAQHHAGRARLDEVGLGSRVIELDAAEDELTDCEDDKETCEVWQEVREFHEQEQRQDTWSVIPEIPGLSLREDGNTIHIARSEDVTKLVGKLAYQMKPEDVFASSVQAPRVSVEGWEL